MGFSWRLFGREAQANRERKLQPKRLEKLWGKDGAKATAVFAFRRRGCYAHVFLG
jgi:hypothetical protein